MEHAEVIDKWLQQEATTRAQYISKVVNRKSSIDGLFVWLAAVSQSCHMNIIHAGGVWTTCASELVVMTDASIMYIMHCFLSIPAMYLANPDKDSSTDSKYIKQFCNLLETQDNFITIPGVLNDLVHDLEGCLDEIGLVPTSNVKPLQELFAEILVWCRITGT